MIARLQWHGTMLRSDGVRNHRTCPDCRNPHTWRRRMEDRKPVRNAYSSGSCLAAFGLPTSLAWHGYLSSGCPFGRAGKEPRRVPSPLNEVAREPRASSDGRRSWFGQCPRPGGPHANAGLLCSGRSRIHVTGPESENDASLVVATESAPHGSAAQDSSRNSAINALKCGGRSKCTACAQAGTTARLAPGMVRHSVSI